MRKLGLLVILLCSLVLAAACWGDTITSHLGRQGPAFAPGVTPKTLGWGPDDQPYPDKFVVNPQDGAEMAWIPPGEFMMGSTSEEQDYAWGWSKQAMGEAAKREEFNDENPQHKVRITKGFWLYRHTVTNAQYRRFDAGHDCGAIRGISLNGDKQPVVDVPWNRARDYCEWAGARLPTEAEWEYACRAGTQTKFWWGDSETDAGKCANVADRTFREKLHMQLGGRDLPIFDTDDGYALTAPVGSYQANAFGLYDMLGNAYQWCADWYDGGYYATSPGEDPGGPSSGIKRVLRGGSWGRFQSECRASNRYGYRPDGSSPDFGFRCARTP